MGCGASRVGPTDGIVSALIEYDEDLEAVLHDGHIRLLSASWLLALPPGWVWERHQDLFERAEGAFVPPEEAVDALAGGSSHRSIAAVSHPWLCADHPDPKGVRLAAVQAFLRANPTVTSLFFDFCSVPQEPRTEDDALALQAALDVMCDLYASPLGTTVLRFDDVPSAPDETSEAANHRPWEQRGWCIFEEAVSAETVAHLLANEEYRAVLKAEPVAKVSRVDAAGGIAEVPIEADANASWARGRFEQVLANLEASHFTVMQDKTRVESLYCDHCFRIGNAAIVDRLYIGDLDEHGELVPGHGTMRLLTGDVFVGEVKSDEPTGRGTMEFKSGDVYEGEWLAGDPHGVGTLHFHDGNVYEGEWVEGQMQGLGTFKWVDGDAYVGQWKAGQKTGGGFFYFSNGMLKLGNYHAGSIVGETVRWDADRRSAVMMRSGEEVSGILLEAAEEWAIKSAAKWKMPMPMPPPYTVPWDGSEIAHLVLGVPSPSPAMHRAPSNTSLNSTPRAASPAAEAPDASEPTRAIT